VLVVIAGLGAYVKHDALANYWHWVKDTRPFMNSLVRPHVLTAAAERALQPGKPFKECAIEGQDLCPEMIVIPGGSFLMGSPSNEPGRSPNEDPQHKVTIAEPFAVSKFAITFAEWDICVQYAVVIPTSARHGAATNSR
jgi:formylglycine-generating enzyme required for sulfatase activity